MSAQLVDLLGALARVPALPGARCRGRAKLFDGDDGLDGDRTRQAAALCQVCPALAPCSRWADRQRANTLDGVVAGRLYRHAGHRSERRHLNGVAVRPITEEESA